MKNINTQLKKKIMRRIYFTFFLRKVFNPLATKMYVLASFVGFIATQVSLVNVVANMPNVTNIGALYIFSTSAFLNTEFVIQLLFVGMLSATFLLLKDIVNIYSVSSHVTI